MILTTLFKTIFEFNIKSLLFISISFSHNIRIFAFKIK